MIAEQVGKCIVLWDGIFAHRNATRSCKIILGDLRTCQFIVAAHEVRGHAIDRLCHTIAVAVVNKGSIRKCWLRLWGWRERW